MKRPVLIFLAFVATLSACQPKRSLPPGNSSPTKSQSETGRTAPPATTQGPGDAGGGNEVVFDFQQAAQRALDEIPSYSALSEINVKELKETLTHAKLLLSKEPLFSDAAKQQPAVAINQPDSQTITIHGQSWKAIFSGIKKESIALHELLSLRKLESTGVHKLSQLYLLLRSPNVPAKYTDIVRPQVLNELEDPRLTIVAFTDMTSPFYAWETVAFEQIAKEYGDKVQIVFRNYPISVVNEHATASALAGICASAQGKFRPVHDAIVIQFRPKWAGGRNEGYYSGTVLDLLKDIEGLNIQELQTCMKSSWAQMRLDQDLTLANELKMMGAPTHLVTTKFEKKVVDGARKYEQWKAVIDKMLARNYFDSEVIEESKESKDETHQDGK